MLIEKCIQLNFKATGDSRGNMVVVEGGQAVPFDINRLFYIYGTDPEAVRGQHANRNSDFAMVCMCSSCKVKITDGTNEAIVSLDDPTKGIYIPRMLWKDMYDFSEDAVLMVMASTHYDANEYIRDFEEYRKEMHERTAVGGLV